MNKTGLLLIHGFFEHKERHRINADWFNNLGIDTYLIDLPGHGEGALVKGDLETWDEINKVIKDGFAKINNYENKIIFGHSVGGQVALHSILTKLINPDFLILSAPTLGDNYPKIIKTLSKSIANIFPKLRIPSSVNKKNLSTDKDVVSDYFSDPLVFRSVTARYGNELLKSQELVNENITELSLPTILFHGEEDKIVPIESSSELSKLQNVTYVPIQGSKHELLNQDTRPFVLSELHSWLNQNKLI